MHQQESIKVNWSSSGATEHTKECHGHFDWLHPKTLSMKNRYYDGKVRESLEIDMVVVRYGQDKVLRQWGLCYWNWNLMSFCIEWRFSVVLSSVLKQLQPVWRKYQVLNNKNFCSTFSRLQCLIFIIWRGGSIEIGRLRSRILDVDGQGCGGSWKLDNFQVCHMCIIPNQWEESYYCTDFRSLLNCVSCVGPWVSWVMWVAWVGL